MLSIMRVVAAGSIFAGLIVPVSAAEYLQGTERTRSRAYSPAVVTDGGKIIWLAGQTGFRDDQGKEVIGFEAQARQTFHAIDQTLKKTGGSLANLVTMTVFILDARYGDKLTEIRREMFPNGNFPGSALITVSGFAVPGILIEIQGVAVIGDRCSAANPCLPR
jgi:2-iminobutanoate/2-iminopropanoate deaminase